MGHLEDSLDQCIKCNVCMTACPVAAVSPHFPGPKVVGPQAQRFRHADQPVPDASVDYCSGCRVCNEVCPAGVRIAELNARARAQLVAAQGQSLRNRIIARAGLVGRLSSGPHAPLLNMGLGLRPLRWVMEQVIQIHRDAPLPPASRHTFGHWFRQRGQRRGLRQVVYYHGCSTQYYEPWVGQAAVAVLEHNGFEVIVPDQDCCGLPLLSNGDFRSAERQHRYNVAQLIPYVRQGIPVVGTSTSCILTLKEEAPELLDLTSQEVADVAAHTYDIFEFLRTLAERNELKTDFRAISRTLPYHPPCQLRAHRIGLPALDVLSLIPGLRLVESQAACCGIAGTYGLKREKYALAMAVGAPLFQFVRESGSDLALCDSETCRWQISHATGVTTKHPIEILAAAYGL
ncbi:sn-glycerol-3-phosphate dehydrogenase subunit C [Oscillochloris trichoides DG-6]|uniref:Sn-glycerol-3-phosphate dehydrogenase subunit C n=1 Tax=Oscillochloris trichoides DG-6 TaxID=765420 RepID=E1IG65_9CHLR|nr:anaerobic glycerol-3-phosphate dehydrogenase subunit C [Oscillochloris trichoides]EFO79799.1 sn-glycerol-3-phosphate dehydrogenase subunit C [Oscillochloris trichoides DG-6]